MTDGLHAREAILAAQELLIATGHGEAEPWIPIGVGVNSGVAYVGAVGTDEHVEFTALGDSVNVTARLSASAAAGEVLVTEPAIRSAGLSDQGLEHRRLDLKGKSEAAEVVVVTAGAALSPLPNAPAGT